ncbi:BTAD domain-containing putative transcriptional regulator [Micromonospora sp. NPDC050686]|uniref:AfsR/SARP family transcriptional regulator n=1 Tax=Micromonospora sp. NPDC050686 TaxID=3154631 RepID=UPI00340EE3B3
MEFRLLGTVEIRVAGDSLPIGGAKPRTLLAALLVQHGRVIPAERLLEVIWGSSPPERARAILQTYVSSVRQLIRIGPDGASLTTRAPGYVLDIPADRLDRDIFERLVGEGRQAAGEGRHEEAAEILRGALAQWRGPALGGVRSDVLAGEAARLDEMRLAAVEERIAAELALGRLAEAAAELADLVRRHPFRERMRGQLMVALYGLGRQSEALLVYREARTSLVEELGVEPGPELQAVHRQILSGALRAVTPSRPPGRSTPAVDHAPAGSTHTGGGPAQLPADPADFTGRSREVAALTAALSPVPPAGSVPVQLILGPGGVGKSVLAAHVAHQVATEYPDGQLYADLRGTADQPAAAHEILGRFLRALDQASTVRLPSSGVERAERYRTLLAGRRVLVVLDNARDERQIRPLLPGSATCGVLVTSRRRLAGLAGSRTVELEVMPPQQAETLLSAVIGSDRATAEPDAVHRVVQFCGGLPLAVRVAGARLANRRSWPVHLLADRLADERHRLDELSAGDQDVRMCIATSYQQLDPSARVALRVCGMLGMNDFPSWILAAALDLPPTEAERVLERLVDVHLVDAVAVDQLGQVRYGLHDLVRLYAWEQARVEDPDRVIHGRVLRVVAAWHQIARSIRTGLTAPGTGTRPPSWVLPADGPAMDRIRVDPVAWLMAERQTWAATATLATAFGLEMPPRELILRPVIAGRSAAPGGTVPPPPPADAVPSVAAQTAPPRRPATGRPGADQGHPLDSLASAIA